MQRLVSDVEFYLIDHGKNGDVEFCLIDHGINGIRKIM